MLIQFAFDRQFGIMYVRTIDPHDLSLNILFAPVQ